ncbi:MAG: hypothetical protein RL660_595 [Bacteroidota bacterium]|jgi:UDP-N-acetylmuramyl pentapeptide phosphotransferase/UDP-N-acetylglucosamine-1-phosphate transferase
MAGNYIFSFLLALIVSAVTQFLIIRLSHKRGIFIDDHESDQPQKFHDAPTPRIGGIGVFLACLLIMLHGKIGIFLIISSIPAFLAGVFEDFRGDMSPKIRLAIMLASGFLAIWLCDAVVTDFGFFSTPLWLGIIISFIAIVGVINGTNLIDGVNGNIGIICCIIFGSFASLSYVLKDDFMLVANILIVGALFGFLLFNYPRGQIFMGDGGAYLLGFLISVISMIFARRHSAEISPIFVLVCVAYPVLEVIFSFSRKLFFEKIGPLHPDKLHLHQLIARGLCNGINSRVVLYIAPFIFANNFLAVKFYNNGPMLFCQTVVFLAIYIGTYVYLRKSDQSLENT